MGQDQNAGSQFMHAPPPSPLHDLGAFVLGNDALHCQEHLILRRIGDLSIDEVDLAAVSLELLDDHDLVGVATCQTIGTMHQHGVDQAISYIITKPVETGTR
jgi:hypothetical protein